MDSVHFAWSSSHVFSMAIQASDPTSHAGGTHERRRFRQPPGSHWAHLASLSASVQELVQWTNQKISEICRTDWKPYPILQALMSNSLVFVTPQVAVFCVNHVMT